MRTARRWGEHCVSVGWNLSESWSFFPSVWRFISKKTASFFEENREFFRRKPRGLGDFACFWMCCERFFCMSFRYSSFYRVLNVCMSGLLFVWTKTASFVRGKPHGFTQAFVLLRAFACVLNCFHTCYFFMWVFAEFWPSACRVCALFGRKPRVFFEENREDLHTFTASD